MDTHFVMLWSCLKKDVVVGALLRDDVTGHLRMSERGGSTLFPSRESAENAARRFKYANPHVRYKVMAAILTT